MLNRPVFSSALKNGFCNEVVVTIFARKWLNLLKIMKINESNPIEQPQNERIAYSIPEAAKMLGLDYFSIYRLVQRGKLKACRALRGKFLISSTELFRLLNEE
jgi:excisionase family DNA binding protein